MAEFLKIVGTKLERKGLNPTDIESASAFVRMLTKGSDGQLLMSQDEIKNGLRQATQKVELRDPEHLFVAGKVLQMYDLWNKCDATAGVVGPSGTRTAERLRVADGTSSMLQYIEMDERMIT